MDVLGHTPTPFLSVLSCHLCCFLPSDSQVLDCASPVCTRSTWTSLKARVGNLSVQRLSKYVLVIHSYHMAKPAPFSFTEYIIHTVLPSSDSDLFVCYSVLPGNAQDALLPPIVISLMLLLMWEEGCRELYGKCES